MILRPKNQKRAEVQFKKKFQQSQQNAIREICKYILIVFVFFTMMYTFMRSVSSIPFGHNPSRNPNISVPADIDTLHIPVISQPKPKSYEAGHTENANDPINDYIKFKNHMATQVKGVSRGLFEKFEARHEHNLVQLYCDSLKDECIGYAFNKNAGYQFYSSNTWPVAKKNGWDFYMKQDPNKPLILKARGMDINDMDPASKEKYKTNMVLDGDTPKKEEDKQTDDIPTKEDNNILIAPNPPDIITDEIPPKEATKRYISYAQNVGRVNNQLVSFEAMIQYALYYKRILVIPWPRHINHVMGFECNYWDFDRLKEIIDFVMEDELPQHLKEYREEGDVAEECRFIKLVGKGIPLKSNQDCEMIYLFEGDMGIFHFRDGPKDVMKYIIPAPYIRDAVEKFLLEEFGELKYRIGVHRRAMKEGGSDPKTGDVHVCRWESRGIHGDSRFGWLRDMISRVTGDNKQAYEKIIAIYHHSCAMDFNDLQNILIFHKQEAIKDNEKFFIAHDHQEQFVVDAMKVKGGIEQPRGRWSHADKCYDVHRKKCREYGHCAKERELIAKEEILFDMWALYYSEFLAGTWMSTLTRTVCHWKGFNNSLYTGNLCFLKWKWQDTMDGVKDDWYTLEGVNETALFD